MKRVLLSFSLVIMMLYGYSQCTPDAGLIYSGIYPRTLPNGQEGVPYSQVIQFKVPKDTLGLTVDSLYIMSITGGPTGTTYQCNVPTCSYKGNVNGCAVLTAPLGAGSAGTYTLDVSVRVKLKSSLPFVPPVYQTFSNTLDLVVDEPVGIEDILNSRDETRGISLYPNPASKQVVVNLDAVNRQQSSLLLVNMHGRVLHQRTVSLASGANTVMLDIASVPQGVYAVLLRIDGRYVRTKLIVR
jgi:hypothetical protein